MVLVWSALHEVASLAGHVRVPFPVSVRLPVLPFDPLLLLFNVLQGVLPWLYIHLRPNNISTVKLWSIIEKSNLYQQKLAVAKSKPFFFSQNFLTLTIPRMTNQGKEYQRLNPSHSNETMAAVYGCCDSPFYGPPADPRSRK